MNTAIGLRSLFCLLICLFLTQELSGQQVSCTIQKPPTNPASQAFTSKNYPKALELYTAASKSNPQDMDAIAGQVRSLLAEQQVDAASDLAEKSVAAHPKNAVLATVLSEVRFRQGRLADTFDAYRTSMALDPCLARTRYDLYRVMRIESMYASAYTQLQAAHQLEPDDPDIHIAWIDNLPLTQRSKEIDAYLANPKNKPLGKQQDMKEYADRLHAILAAKNGSCSLTSSATTATMPFEYLDPDQGGRYHGLGFDVKVNNKAKARLELDTGASGILLDRGTAKKAGLVPITTDTISGIGDEKSMSGYWAYADDFRVGSLEFKNCMIEVSDKRSINDIDGLIGANVFENYHVQLDFPLRKMTLSPLPPRPGETGSKTSLNASGVGNSATASMSQPAKASGSTAPPPAIHYYDRYVNPEMKSWSPFARFGHQILINAQLKDNKPRLFLLDSGANISFLSIPAAKSIGKIHFDDEDQITGLNGRVKKVYTANYVDVYFARLRDPFKEILVMNLDNLSNDNGTEVSGIIGLDTLLMLTVDIDYRDGLIHLAFDPKHGTNIYGGYTY